MSAARPHSSPHTAVIGAGWAGCAAALELQVRGHQITIFEAAKIPGGRARQVTFGGHVLDNGQHILLGAYSETLKRMRQVGLSIEDAFLRLPLQMCYPADTDGMTFMAARLPAPFHLLSALWGAQGLEKQDKLALIRFSSAARWMGWQLEQDCSVSELLLRFEQTPRLVRLMWRPLCIAALNTPPEVASAKVFLNVLRDSLGAARADSDMLIPRLDMTALFPGAALQQLVKRGAHLHCQKSVKGLQQQGHQWQLRLNGTPSEQASQLFDGVILATQAPQAARLLVPLADNASLLALEHTPITTCYLQYPESVSLPRPMFALIDDADKKEWAQFVFDRGQLVPSQAGLLAAVISTSEPAIAAGHSALAQEVAQQLASALRLPQLAKPLWSQVITDKRATFFCVTDVARPPNVTSIPTLMLAGDYTVSDYPATLEGAVRSGGEAARLLDAALQI